MDPVEQYLTVACEAPDLGECYCSSMFSFPKLRLVLSNSYEDSALCVKRSFFDDSFSNIPVHVKLLDLDTEESVVLPEDSKLYVPAASSVAVICILTPVFTEDNNLLQNTSYLKINASFNIPYEVQVSQESLISNSFKFCYSVCLCASILFVEQNSISFENCRVKETSFREFQLWNRSECILEYQIGEFSLLYNDEQLPLSTCAKIRAEDGENGKVLQLNESVSIAPFASQRIKVLFEPLVQGLFALSCTLTNKNNSSNSVSLTMKANAKEATASAPKRCPIELFEDDSELNVLIATTEGGEDFVMDFGDCYSGVKKIKRCWLRNITQRNLEVCMVVPTDQNIVHESGFFGAKEVVFDCSTHIPDDVYSYEAFKEQYSSITSTAQFLEDPNDAVEGVTASGEITDKITKLPEIRTADESVGSRVRDVNASESVSLQLKDEMKDGLIKRDISGAAAVKENNKAATGAIIDAPLDKIALWGSKLGKSSQTVTSTPRNASGGSKSGGKQSRGNENSLVCGRMWGDVCLLSSVDAEEDEEAWTWRDCTPALVFAAPLEGEGVANSRPFIGRAVKNVKGKQLNKAAAAAAASVVMPPRKMSTAASEQQQQMLPPSLLSPILTEVGGSISVAPATSASSSSAAVAAANGGVSINTEAFSVNVDVPTGPATNEDPATYNFSTFSGAFSPDLLQHPTLKLPPLSGTSTSTETPDSSYGFTSVKFVLKPQEMTPCSIVLTPSPHYIDAAGQSVGPSLMARSIRTVLTLKYVNVDESDGSPVPVPTTDAAEDEFLLKNLELNLKMRTCVSTISVPQLIYDLGLCSVGEFRSVVVNVNNDCDLPASIYSFVQSETLAILDPELVIPPRSSKPLKVEYVAHEENTMYTKQALLVNIHNPSNNVHIEVRAKNVDTQQVLLHSLFYKMITFNNRRQLQVMFEKCLINMPNLKTFCIKNIHHRTLRIEIIVERGKCLQIFLVKSPEEMKALTEAQMTPSIGSGKPLVTSTAVSSKSSKYTKVNDFDMEDFVNNPAEVTTSAAATDKVESSAPVQPVVTVAHMQNSTAMNQHIEDLKWGNDNEENRMLLFSKSANLRIGGIDNEFHMTKGEKMSLMNQMPISSDLNALDVMPTASSTSSVTNAMVGVLSSQNQKLMASLDLSSSSSIASTYRTTNDLLLTSVGDLPGKDASGLLSSQAATKSGSTAQKEAAVLDTTQLLSRYFNLIQELDKETFPHSILEKYASNETDIDFSKSMTSKNELSSTKNEIEQNVRALQRTYGEFKALMDSKGQSNSLIHPLQEVVQPSAAPAEDGTAANEVTSPSSKAAYRSFFVDIPSEAMYTFAVILFPRSRGDTEESNKTTISENIQFRLPQITVAEIESALQASAHDRESVAGTMSQILNNSSENKSEFGDLKPRSMLIRARATLSEMIAIQKNISFGRTLVGEKTSRMVTLINRSSIPCLFSVSKSGSISSGFLQLPEGRKGVIPPYSTKHLEFVFKPTLSGSFEETIHIDNMLNPKNTQSIVIKAKVNKAESFSLMAHSNPIVKVDSKSSFAQVVDDLTVTTAGSSTDFVLSPSSTSIGSPSTPEKFDIEVYYKSKLEQYLTELSSSGPSSSAASTAAGGTTSTATTSAGIAAVSTKSSVPPVFMGSVAVGEPCEVVVQFRIKNLTSKKRQFIVDATHSSAVALLAAIVLSGREKFSETMNASNRSPGRKSMRHRSKSLAHLTEENNPFVLPVEPIPENLQSVVSLRCKFSAVHSNQEKSAKAGKSESSLSEEERLVLEDSLEKFQQKLKIAIRKNKPEKIEKYQKKINKVISCLTGVKEDNSGSAGGMSSEDKDSLLKEAKKGKNEDDEEGKPEDTAAAAAAAAATAAVPASAGAATVPAVSSAAVTAPSALSSVPAPAIVEESEVAIFYLDPDQEKVISVKVTFLPGTSYVQWSGVLPFLGCLRVFECRNEDLVKTIHFGALVFSSRVAYNSEKTLTNDTDAEEDSFDVNTDSVVNLNRSIKKGNSDRLSISSIAELQKVENSFIVTVAQWSSLNTKLIYPKYRQLPENVLGMSVKLVHASKDRVMYGALSVASVIHLKRSAMITLTVDSSFNVKSSSDYVAYNSNIHGAISFGLISSTTNNSSAYESHLSYASMNKDETVEYSESSTQCTMEVGGKLLFIIKWRPPAEELKNDVNLLGAIKIQCKVKEQIVGAEQFVPFVCVGQHKSIFKVDRTYSFGDVSMSSYRMASIPITNTSDSEDLNYIVTSEELAQSSSAVGKVQFNNGQTGVIPPNSSKMLQLLFSATAAGKFEQKLWIRNVGDGFDQKRIVIQANVIVTQAKFVTFPDLEYSLDSSEGRYKTIDLGQIQIQSMADAGILTQHPAFQQELTPQNVYRLRIENVSDQTLNVTAISNLKSQCFIYSDEACTQLAINTPMEVAHCTTLYVQIKPVYLQVKSGEWLSTSKSTASLGSLGSLSSNNSVKPVGETTVDSKSKHVGRELKGGIRLIFFVMDAVLPSKEEDASTTVSAPTEFIQRKLFETALSFRAVVGQSRLKLKTLTPSLRYVSVTAPSFLSVDAGDGIYYKDVRGKFEIKNESTVFHARYSYLLDSTCCVGRPSSDSATLDAFESSSSSSVMTIGTGINGANSKLQLRIADAFTEELKPGETKSVEYCVQYACGNELQQSPSGLVLHSIQVVNLSTKEVSSIKFGIFFDAGQVQSTSAALGSPSGTNDEFSGLSCDLPIWLTGLDSKMRSRKLKKLRAEDDYFTSDLENESVISDNNNPNTVWYEITGAGNRVLGSCIISNSHEVNPLTLTPVSDLPVVITIESTLSERRNTERSRATHKSRHMRKVSTDSLPPSSSTAPSIYGRWKRTINKVGEPFTILPQGSVRVVMCAKSGYILDDELLEDLSRSKLESGSQCKLGGIVAFVQAAHALQSLFDPSPQVSALALSPSPQPRIDETASGDNLVKPPIFPLMQQQQQGAPQPPERVLFETLPFVYMLKSSCQLVVPKLSVPVTVFALGKLRCGYKACFEVTIENGSDVDIPCCLSGLPSWLTLHPDNFESGSFEETALDDLEYDALIDAGESPFSTKFTTNKEPFNANSGFAAKKLQWWLENKNMDDKGSGELVTDDKNDKLVGDLTDITLERHQLRFAAEEDYCVAGEPLTSNDNLEQLNNFENEDYHDAADDDNSAGGVNDNQEEEEDDENKSYDFAPSQLDSMPMDLDSMMVHRQSEIVKRFTAPRASKMTIKLIVQAPFIESQRLEHKIRVKNLASSSESLQSSDFDLLVQLDVDSSKAIEIRPGANEPLVVVASRQATDVALNAALSPSSDNISLNNNEVSPVTSPVKMSAAVSAMSMGSACYRLIKEPLIVPPPVVSTFTEEPEQIRCESVGVDDSSNSNNNNNSSNNNGGNGTSSDGRLSAALPINIPPSIKATHKLSSEAKHSCSFFLTNHVASSVKITTNFAINPLVAQVLDIQFKFHQNNDSSILMMAKETVEARIAINSKISSRFEDIGALAMTYPVLESDLQMAALDDKVPVRKDDLTPLVIQLPTSESHATMYSAEEAKVPSTTTLASMVSSGTAATTNKKSSTAAAAAGAGAATTATVAGPKTSVGPILFGTLCFRPAVQPERLDQQQQQQQQQLQQQQQQQRRRDRSVSFDLTDGGYGDTTTGFNLVPMDENESSGFVAPQDVIFVDVVGYLTAGPTASITKLTRQTVASSASSGAINAIAPSPVTSVQESNSVVAPTNTTITTNTTVASASTTASNDLAHLLVFRIVEDFLSEGEGSSSTVRNFRLTEEEQSFYLSNPSSTQPLNFLIKSGSYRYAGMRLQLPNNNSGSTSSSSSTAWDRSEGFYDTVTVKASPSRGSITPGGSLIVTVNIVPGNPADSVKAATTVATISDLPDKTIRAIARGDKQKGEVADTRSVLACIPLMIVDTDWPLHPPRKVSTYLVSDRAISALLSLPVSESKYNSNSNSGGTAASSGGNASSNGNAGSSAVEDLSPVSDPSDTFSVAEKERKMTIAGASSSSNNGTTFSPELFSSVSNINATANSTFRLRGVTPASSNTPGRFVIDLKQQTQRKEAVEWLVNIESSGTAGVMVPFAVHVISPPQQGDQNWLTVGQSRGVIPSGSSSSVMLYFSRSNVGLFSGYVVIQNRLLKTNDQVIFVTMEVVSTENRKGSIKQQQQQQQVQQTAASTAAVAALSVSANTSTVVTPVASTSSVAAAAAASSAATSASTSAAQSTDEVQPPATAPAVAAPTSGVTAVAPSSSSALGSVNPPAPPPAAPPVVAKPIKLTPQLFTVDVLTSMRPFVVTSDDSDATPQEDSALHFKLEYTDSDDDDDDDDQIDESSGSERTAESAKDVVRFLLTNTTEIPLDFTVSVRYSNQVLFDLFCSDTSNCSSCEVVSESVLTATVAAHERVSVLGKCRSSLKLSRGASEVAVVMISVRLFEELAKCVKVVLHG